MECDLKLYKCMSYMTCELYFNKTAVFKKSQDKEIDGASECRVSLKGGKEPALTSCRDSEPTPSVEGNHCRA